MKDKVTAKQAAVLIESMKMFTSDRLEQARIAYEKSGPTLDEITAELRLLYAKPISEKVQ